MDEHNIALTPEDVATIGTALAALPYGQVAPLVQKITAQIEAQKQHAVWLEEQKTRNRS